VRPLGHRALHRDAFGEERPALGAQRDCRARLVSGERRRRGEPVPRHDRAVGLDPHLAFDRATPDDRLHVPFAKPPQITLAQRGGLEA
jgi:hypothetical protein